MIVIHFDELQQVLEWIILADETTLHLFLEYRLFNKVWYEVLLVVEYWNSLS